MANSLALYAQSVTFTGKTPSVNVGNANLCKPGAGTPAPCSVTVTLDYKVTAGGTLGTPRVVTLGVPNLDFTLAEGSTCAGSVTAGSTCTVKVDFSPRIAGGRSGAAQITDGAGKVLLTTPVYGFGIGPQVGSLANYTSVNLSYDIPNETSIFPTQPAVDDAGNAFLAANALSNVNGIVIELPANGSPQKTLPFDFSGTTGPSGGSPGIQGYSAPGLALDGAGDIFVTTYNSNSSNEGLVLELPGGGGPQVTLPFGGLTNPAALGTDGAGDVFVLDDGASNTSNSRIIELPFGCKSSACQVVLTSEPSISNMAVDVAGDIFIIYSSSSPSSTGTVVEIPAGGGTPIQIAANFQINGVVGLAVDGVGDLFSSVNVDTGIGSGDFETLDAVAAEFPANGSSPFTNQYLGSFNAGAAYDGPSFALTADSLGSLFCTTNPGSQPQTLSEFLRSQLAPLNFGSVPVGGKNTLPLGITNTGNRTLVLTPYLKSPSYKILSAEPSGCLAATLPGDTCTLYIQFSGLTAGAHDISLTLGTNSAADATVLLEATATRPAK